MIGSILLGALFLSAGASDVGVGEVREPSGYLFYVASESEDEVTLLRFSPGQGLVIERVIRVGRFPAEIEAPHGVFLDPDGTHWYVTSGHGFPFGSLWKYETGSDTAVAQVELGMFPATVAVAPFGGLALTVNSDFHGDLVPSTVSIVELESMIEIGRTETCTMPHGSRFSPDGLRHYSACMMDDELVEIDVTSLDVSRRLNLVSGELVDHAGTSGMADRRQTCSPTWAAPSPTGAFVYVACNRSDQILEIDATTFEIGRRFESPSGPYNLAVTSDGKRLAATQKGSGALSIWDLEAGDRIAYIPSVRKVTHGVIFTPDDRYALVTVEGIGGEPGGVEVIDMETLQRVATADVGKQAGGIAFWKTVD